MRHVTLRDGQPGFGPARAEATTGAPARSGHLSSREACDLVREACDLVCEACGTVLIPDYWVLAGALPGPVLSDVEMACPACRAVARP